MSSLLNKAKAVLNPDKHRSTGSDNDGSTTTTAATTGTPSSATNTAGVGQQQYGNPITGAANSGTGPAPNTAGPHKTDLGNKLDPRVDSNLDGSKTLGSGGTTTAGSNLPDRIDATTVPPSVLREHIGEPIIAHGNPDSDHARRHSAVGRPIEDLRRYGGGNQ